MGFCPQLRTRQISRCPDLAAFTLRGGRSDLESLTAWFSSGDAYVVKEGDEYHLKSKRLDALPDAESVLRAGQELLERMLDTACFHDPQFISCTVGGVFESNPDGGRKYFAFLKDAIDIRDAVNVPGSSVAQNHGIAVARNRPNTAAAIHNLARTRPEVADALHFLRIGDWVSLYKVYEIIKDDVGGEPALTSKDWVTRNKLKSFTQTAQSRDAVGDAARHAGRGFRAPARPMSLSQAKTLFRDLVTKWMTTK